MPRRTSQRVRLHRSVLIGGNRDPSVCVRCAFGISGYYCQRNFETQERKNR